MNAPVKDVVHDCTKASDEGRITFPEVVMALISAGVERYYADLQRFEKTYYMPNGESHVVPSAAVKGVAPQDFAAAGVEAAVRASQARTITYEEFCRRIVAAGCIGYLVSMSGRRAVYFGRTGDTHVERFPAAA